MTGIQAIKKMITHYNAEGYYTGLYIISLLNNKKHVGPISIVIRGLNVTTITKFLKKYGQISKSNIYTANINKELLKYEKYPIEFRPKNSKQIYKIRLPRVGKKQMFAKKGTLEKDSKHGDFTITSLYLPIIYKEKKEIIDLVKGKKDVKNKKIRLLSDSSIRLMESPIRILKAVYLTSIGFTITTKLYNNIKRNVGLLRVIDSNIVREELNKILLSNKPSTLIELMRKLGILKIILPELEDCVGIAQPKTYHKYDVYTHCLKTCDNVEPDLILRLAALFHDIGKAQTAIKHTNGKTTFYNHDVIGSFITHNILKRLNYDLKTREAVVKLIKLHMYFYLQNWTSTAINNFIKRTQITEKDAENIGEHPLFKLRLADRAGSGVKPATVTKMQKELQDRVKNHFQKPKSKPTKSLDDIKNDKKLQTMLSELDGITFDLLIGLFVSDNNYKIINDIIYYLYHNVKKKNQPNKRLDLIKLATSYVIEKKEKDRK